MLQKHQILVQRQTLDEKNQSDQDSPIFEIGQMNHWIYLQQQLLTHVTRGTVGDTT
jgi:hypothetical protein